MPRQPRWIPKSRPLVEVTTRTFQGRYLLKPTPQVRELILGIVGRAQRMHEMEICMLVFMSNHYHLLLVPRDAEQLARFMGFVNGQIAHEINRASRWKAKVWGRRFDTVLVTDEPSIQRARFRYLLSHGVKEGLVERPGQWVGVHGVDAWLHGQPLEGYWFDRSRETRARKRAEARGETLDRLAFATREEVRLSPLPCWRREGLCVQEIRREIEDMVDVISELARVERSLAGRPAAGITAVLAKTWDHRPGSLPRSPRPRFHHWGLQDLAPYDTAYRDFLQSYRRASEALRSGPARGAFEAGFPDRCFPSAEAFFFDAPVGGG